MKKRSEWCKMRRVRRQLLKAMRKLDSIDQHRANQWNAAIRAAQSNVPDGISDEMFWMFVEKPEDDSNFRDMFIEQAPCAVTETQKSGLYVVDKVSHSSRYDYLLQCRLMGWHNPSRIEFIWFPRLGQRVVSAREAAEYPL